MIYCINAIEDKLCRTTILSYQERDKYMYSTTLFSISRKDCAAANSQVVQQRGKNEKTTNQQRLTKFDLLFKAA